MYRLTILKKLLILGILFSSGWIGGILLLGQRHVTWTEERLNNFIKSEIPARTSKKDVAACIHRHGFEYFGSRYDPAEGDDGNVEEKQAGLTKEECRSWTRATIWEKENPMEFRIYFFFDKNDRLIKYRLTHVNISF